MGTRGRIVLESDDQPIHEIVLRVHGSRSLVSCYCRAVLGKHDRAGGDYHEPMPLDSPNLFDIYNKPENHWAPFTEEDKITT